jgi:phosphoribosyl 1,2-cyclic phosphate phosphodiesterase
MAQLTITFLGTGTSMGVPVVGCDCAVCLSKDPRDRRTRSSIYVETPECAWVVDTGPDFRSQCLRENVRRLDAAVFTHGHTDHIMGFDDLRPFCNDRDIPVFAAPETMDDLRRVYNFAFDGRHRYAGYVRPVAREVDGPFLLGNTELTPLPLRHGRFDVNGWLFSRNGVALAAYLSDCNVVPDEVVSRISSVRVLIIDALRHRAHPTHLTVAEALEISRLVQPQQTLFTHICHELGHAETDAALPPEVRLAFDGMRIEL